MKQDIKREQRNAGYKKAIEDIMKTAKKGGKTMKKEETISKAYSVIDKAAKKKVIHKRKADRMKKGVSRLISAK